MKKINYKFMYYLTGCIAALFLLSRLVCSRSEADTEPPTRDTVTITIRTTDTLFRYLNSPLPKPTKTVIEKVVTVTKTDTLWKEALANSHSLTDTAYLAWARCCRDLDRIQSRPDTLYTYADTLKGDCADFAYVLTTQAPVRTFAYDFRYPTKTVEQITVTQPSRQKRTGIIIQTGFVFTGNAYRYAAGLGFRSGPLSVSYLYVEGNSQIALVGLHFNL